METLTARSPIQPIAPPEYATPETVAVYLETKIPLLEAQNLFGFKRTTFFRFRVKHGIEVLPVRCVSVIDVVQAFENERKLSTSLNATKWLGTGMAAVLEYRSRLLPLRHASAAFKIPGTSFWRFRLRHGIQTLSGGFVHADDLVASLDAQRRGVRRQSNVLYLHTQT